mmetsp:Transcript_28291/g.60746  ORF Transcript_28291/g.60746 Transcript_28291/m.60746 type:complete len:244 (+) Transcript_28291:903-1634(+)
MKVTSTANALLLLVGVSCAGLVSSATPLLGGCKAFCKETRQGILADINSCKPALKVPPVPKLFNACVEGRKKGFDQTCVPICTNAEMTVSSYEGCQAITKKKGQKYVDWCRKGYDGIMQNIESFLVENPVSPKKEETTVEHETEPVNTRYVESEPVQKREQEPATRPRSDIGVEDSSDQVRLRSNPSIKSEPAQSEPDVAEIEVESEEEVAVVENDVYFEQQRRELNHDGDEAINGETVGPEL